MNLSTIDILAAFAAVAGVWMCGLISLRALLRVLGLQTALLGLITWFHGREAHAAHYLLLTGIVIVIKAVAIPMFLGWTASRIDVKRDRGVSLNPSLTLLSGCGALVLGYFLAPRVEGTFSANPGIGGMALTLLFIGMILMLTRRLAISQIIGFLVLENGIFLYAFTLGHGMPLVIEMGVVFDVLVGVMVAGLVIFRLNRSFEHIDVTKLRGLRG